MKTVTFLEIMNQAAEYAQRTRDKLPAVEQTLLQGVLASEFETLFNSQPWEFLIPDFVKFDGITGNMVALDEDTYGDVLAVTTQNPHVNDFWRPVSSSIGRAADGSRILWLNDPVGTVWVEAMLPYPGTAFPELAGLALAAFKTAVCPRQWKQYLARKAAAELLVQDDNAAAMGIQLGLAEKALAAAIMRFCPTPDWRGVNLSAPRSTTMGAPSTS